MTFKHALLWIAGIGIITFAVLFLGWEEVSSALAKADPWFLLGLFGLQLVTLSLIAFQWQYLLNKTSHYLPLRKVMAINLAGSYIESVTPSVKLGGEAAKIFLLRKETDLSYQQLAGVLLAHKYLSLLPFLGLAAFFLALAFTRYQLPPATYLAFFLLLGFFSLLSWMHYRGGKKGEETGIHKKFAEERNDPENSSSPSAGSSNVVSVPPEDAGWFKGRLTSKIIRSLGGKFSALTEFVNRASIHSRELATPGEKRNLLIISTIIWFLYPLKIYLVAHMLGLEPSLVTAAIVAFTAYVISMVPVLPGGLGTFEGSMVLMFTLGGYDPAQGLAVALLSRLVTFWFPLILSAVAAAYMTVQHTRHQQPSQGG